MIVINIQDMLQQQLIWEVKHVTTTKLVYSLFLLSLQIFPALQYIILFKFDQKMCWSLSPVSTIVNDLDIPAQYRKIFHLRQRVLAPSKGRML